MCLGCVNVLCIEYTLSAAQRNTVTVCKAVILCPHGYSTCCEFGSKQRFKSGFSLPFEEC